MIELRTLLPVDNSFKIAIVVGFAEGARVIVVFTEIGHFFIDLNSEQARKVSEPGIHYPVVPIMSFYTPGMVLALCSLQSCIIQPLYTVLIVIQ